MLKKENVLKKFSLNEKNSQRHNFIIEKKEKNCDHRKRGDEVVKVCIMLSIVYQLFM
jgi:hypothetical protein